MSKRESTPWRRHLNRLATTLADVLFPVPPIPPYCYGGFGDVDIDQAEQLADYEADRDHLDPHALVCFRCGLDPITCTHELPATPPAGIAGPASSPRAGRLCTTCGAAPAVLPERLFARDLEYCAACFPGRADLFDVAGTEIVWLTALAADRSADVDTEWRQELADMLYILADGEDDRGVAS